MAASPQKFAQLLTTAVHNIRTSEPTLKKTVRMVQDELGYALGRQGGSSIEYWRKGNIPAVLDDLEKLTRELVRRKGLNSDETRQFLVYAEHPQPGKLWLELFPAQQEFATFVVGPPITHPRQFFGREPELKRIFAICKRFPLQNIAVVGFHRSGKSSLLHYLQSITKTNPKQLRPGQRHNWLPHPENFQWLIVDFQDARMGQQESLLRYILSGLHLPLPDPCNLSNFLDVVSHQLQTPSMILMDEIGAGLAAPELDQNFWWSLRALGSNYTGGKLGFLLTAHEVPALLAHEHGKPSPFFNIFGHTLNLGPLSEAAARELMASAPRQFSQANVEWILTHSGCWPALLQILCDTYLLALESGQADSFWHEEGLQRIAPMRYLLEDTC